MTSKVAVGVSAHLAHRTQFIEVDEVVEGEGSRSVGSLHSDTLVRKLTKYHLTTRVIYL